MKKLKLMTAVLLGLSCQMAIAACNADPSDYRTLYMAGSPGGIKLHHVSGTQQCQSNENWGYTCSVQVFDAVDCDNGHARNRNTNCCQFFQNKLQTNGRAISYTPGSCSSFK